MSAFLLGLLLPVRAERPARLRFAIAFCFGLARRFGFAGVLTEIALPQAGSCPRCSASTSASSSASS